MDAQLYEREQETHDPEGPRATLRPEEIAVDRRISLQHSLLTRDRLTQH